MFRQRGRQINGSAVQAVRIIACIVLVAVFFGGGLFAVRSWEQSQVLPETAEVVVMPAELKTQLNYEELTYYKDAWYEQKQGIETMLILGVDKDSDFDSDGGANGYEQADFLVLLVMDTEAHSYTPVQLNRDTMVKMWELDDDGNRIRRFIGQLALAHAYGGTPENGCLNTMNAVANLMYGMPVDHVLSITMDGLSAFNDYVGGVTVEVKDDFSAVDKSLVQGETVTLKGDQALTYVRARKGMDEATNLNRMERQMEYMNALKAKLVEKTAKDPTYIVTALLDLSKYLVSDCTANELSNFLTNLEEYTSNGIVTPKGEAVMGEKYIEFNVDQDALQDLVVSLYYDCVEGEPVHVDGTDADTASESDSSTEAGTEE